MPFTFRPCTSFVLLAAVALASACSSPAAVDPFVGRWSFDGGATFAANEAQMRATMPAEQVEQILPKISRALSRSSGWVHLHDSGTMTGARTLVDVMRGTTTEQELVGAWEYVGDRVVGTSAVVGEEDVVMNHVVTIDPDGRLLMSSDEDGQDMTIVFERDRGEGA